MKTARWRSSMKPAPLSSLLALALTVLAPGLSYGGEIDIHYTDLGKKLTLTATQNGNEIGNPTCFATGCSLLIEGADAVDFPQIALLVAGVESVPAALLLKTVLTDLVHYSSSNYLKGDPAEACDGDLSLCSADVSLEFFASPYGFILTGNNSPSFQQAPADGVEHEITVYFENQALASHTVVGLPPAAIHVFIKADGANLVDEPATDILVGVGLAGVVLMRLRRRTSNRGGAAARA